MKQLSAAGRTALVATLVSLASCTDQPLQPDADPQFSRTSSEAAATEALDQMDAVNAALSEAGADYRVFKMEYIEMNGMGAELLARDLGNKRIGAQFVPFDPRREWSPPSDDVTFAIDQVDAMTPNGLSPDQTNPAILASMGTWDTETCSDLGLTWVSDFGLDLGLVAFQNGLGGSPFVVADIQHAGFSDIDFTGDLGNVIAATYTFVWLDDAGAPTDVDGDGYADTAFTEIYYDPSWLWTVGPGGIDVESIALHEVGHALSQGHFGNLFLKKGVLSASPRAVMNALYDGVLRELRGTDRGGHCGIWGNWPQTGAF